MAQIVLIHGSTQNSSCWDLVRPHLEAAGHRVVAVNPPSDRPDASAGDLARIVCNHIPPSDEECVIVAHSASGVLLPFIAQHRLVAAIVYLAAMIPEAGLTAMEQFERDPSIMSAEWIEAGPRWRDPANWRELADRFLFHDVVRRQREWAYSTMRLTRFDGALREVSPGPLPEGVRAMNVVCELDRTIRADWQRSIWKEPDPSLRRMQAGHCPHLSTPRETAGAILLAENGERRKQIREAIETMKANPNPPTRTRPEPLAEPVSYDDLMALDPRTRHQTFIRMTPQMKSETMRTHLGRWLDEQRERLTFDQVALVGEWIEHATPEAYGPSDRELLDRERDELVSRSFELFTREELFEATTMMGRGAAPKT